MKLRKVEYQIVSVQRRQYTVPKCLPSSDDCMSPLTDTRWRGARKMTSSLHNARTGDFAVPSREI